MKDEDVLFHPFEPVWTARSTVLILGTFPSVASREKQFYYGHTRNRFWAVIAGLYGEDVPETTDARKTLLVRHNIAVWDVLRSCGITGSDDASIRRPAPNDIAGLVSKSAIGKILLNGKKAHELYMKYCAGEIEVPAVCLPSTSPANAAWGLERLLEAWGAEILD